MTEQERQTLEERIAALEATLASLEEIITIRISQEEKLQKQLLETLRAELGGEIKAIEVALKSHCGEQRVQDGKINESMNTVHRRFDELLMRVSEADEKLYKKTDNRVGNLEVEIKEMKTEVIRIDRIVLTWTGRLVGAGAFLYLIYDLISKFLLRQ